MGIGAYRYVVVNTLVSVVAFGRNLLFLRTLGLADLGQVALMQTIVMLVGFLQVGTMNGAFLLFVEARPEQTRRVVIVLNFGTLLCLALAAVLFLSGAGGALTPVVAKETLIIGVVAGVATLASTWMNNLLIAQKALGRSNLISMMAVSASLAAAALSLHWGLLAALASILLQPLLVAIGVLIVEPEARAVSLRPDPTALRLIWSLGIMQFLGGLAVLMTYQVERWSISLLLGNEQLGQFYLVMMFAAFFQLVPAALMNVHLPLAVQALKGTLGEDGSGLRAVLRRHLAELLVYGALVILAVVTIAPVLVRLLAPQFETSIRLLVLAFPALMILGLRDNATLALYAQRRMQPLLVSGVLLLASYSALLGIASLAGHFSLEAVVVLRGVAAAVAALYLHWACRPVLSERGLRK